MSGFSAEGRLKPDYATRLGQVIEAADAAGMAVILGLFYGHQSKALSDEPAVIRAVTETVDWLCARGARNVLLEIGNEVDLGVYVHDIIGTARCHELIQLAQTRSGGRLDTPTKRLLVSTSFVRPQPPPAAILDTADFLLPHGNWVHSSDGIRTQLMRIRNQKAYRGQPITYNEDDHFEFDRLDNNFVAAVTEYAGWGYFDYRHVRERFADGFQSLPVDWAISSPRKRAFFGLLKEITGA